MRGSMPLSQMCVGGQSPRRGKQRLREIVGLRMSHPRMMVPLRAAESRCRRDRWSGDNWRRKASWSSGDEKDETCGLLNLGADSIVGGSSRSRARSLFPQTRLQRPTAKRPNGSSRRSWHPRPLLSRTTVSTTSLPDRPGLSIMSALLRTMLHYLNIILHQGT